MINIKFVRFTLVVYVSHKVNVLVTDIILNITSQEQLIFTSLHIGSRLFELFRKEVRVKKKPGMPLTYIKFALSDTVPKIWRVQNKELNLAGVRKLIFIAKLIYRKYNCLSTAIKAEINHNSKAVII